MAWQQDLVQLIVLTHVHNRYFIESLIQSNQSYGDYISTHYTDWEDTKEIGHQAWSHFYFKLIHRSFSG
jgi:hypothetical protein